MLVKRWLQVYIQGMLHPVDVAAKAVGGRSRLAEKLKLTRQAISKWRSSRIPAERVIEVERASGISRQILRPDLYL